MNEAILALLSMAVALTIVGLEEGWHKGGKND